MRSFQRVSATGLLVVSLMITMVGVAEATITSPADSMDLGVSMLELNDSASVIESTEYVTPNTASFGVSDATIGQFPTHGSTFAILSSGNVQSGSNTNWGTTGPHPQPQGDPGDWGEADPATVHDPSHYSMQFRVPTYANCMSIDTQFLTDELGGPDPTFDDQFLVLLNSMEFIGNIAFDPNGYRFQAKASGASDNSGTYTTQNASGSTYNYATPVVTQTAPVAGGELATLDFWIYDIGDGTIDSAAFIDRLSFGAASDCRAPLTTKITGPNQVVSGKATRYDVTVTNPTSAGIPLDSIQLNLPAPVSYVPGSTQGVTTQNPGTMEFGIGWDPDEQLSPGESATVSFKLKQFGSGNVVWDVYTFAGDHSGGKSKTVKVLKAPSTTTLEISKSPDKVEASGAVKPKHPTESVKVSLYRKEGGSFDKKATKNADLNSDSKYEASFGRLKDGTCKVVTKFAGDQDHKPSSASKTFDC